jgi:hypothetical protein
MNWKYLYAARTTSCQDNYLIALKRNDLLSDRIYQGYNMTSIYMWDTIHIPCLWNTGSIDTWYQYSYQEWSEFLLYTSSDCKFILSCHSCVAFSDQMKWLGYTIQLFSELPYPLSEIPILDRESNLSSEHCLWTSRFFEIARRPKYRTSELTYLTYERSYVFLYYRRFGGVESPEGLENAPAPKFIPDQISIFREFIPEFIRDFHIHIPRLSIHLPRIYTGIYPRFSHTYSETYLL